MAKPAGMQAKLKDNSKKNYRTREEWMKAKKIGRPKQVFIDTTRFNSTEEIEQLTDAQILALPKPGWQKVGA